jgi:mono/diheme cytochrome c family protein
MVATDATTAIGVVLIGSFVLGWIVYALFNIRGARRELGSEIELAANRKPYYDDETLEGRRLEMVQLFGMLLLIVIVLGLPLYWLFEPSRQAGAEEGVQDRFVGWGEQLFATTADGGFNCAGCHGANGVGGEAPFAVADPKTGEVQSVNWKAPAVNTIFYRFSEDEVRFILVYGRPFSPMSPWGLEGGGPLNAQQIDTLLAYMRSIQIEPVDCAEGTSGFDPDTHEICDGGRLPADVQADIDQIANDLVANGTYDSYGEALFNLPLASGAYSCARCHTPGWSYDQPGVQAQGAFGWNLTGGATNSHFPNEADLIAFLKAGSELGKKYGLQGQGSGRMPGFGSLLTDEQIKAIVEYVRSL